MFLPLWVAVVSFLQLLPLCTASPVAPAAKAGTKQSASDACNNPSSANISSACWTSLQMDDFFTNWTRSTVVANAPMIGTMYCRPNEPTSAQYYYGAYAIYAVFTYINAISSALLSTTAKPGALQSAYASANAGAGAASGANPIDATLVQLLFENGLNDQDLAFMTYIKQNPFAADFAGATTDPPSDAVMYKNLVAVLQQRSQKLFSGWEMFRQVLGTGGEWTGQVQGSADYVKKWTSGTTA
ncbi:MAG: hypothetical protein LQ338_002044 [Usnochroma carphineum]|nr:MAG: hypothetical protein LQ338_002044 [Usnochroma carphineum]